MSRVLIATFDGGGNVPPALRVAAELRSRGHDVTVLGHPGQRGAIEAAGVTALAYRNVPPWDPGAARGSTRFALAYLRLFTHSGFGRDLREAMSRNRPDVVVVDALLPSAMNAAVSSGSPTILLVHTVLSAIRGIARGPVGVVAASKGFSFSRALGAADALIVTSPVELATGPAPMTAHYVGPLFGPGEESPPATNPGSRRILVSLSTIHYAGMERVLQTLVDAVGELDVEAIVTTGPTIDPAHVRAPSHVRVLRSVPHSEVLADAGLVISHGGHGTATRALTAGVPVLARPMSSLGDHLFVARGLEHAGAGRRLPTRASALELTALIDASLRDDALRARAQTLGERLRQMESARLAGDAVEAAMTSAVRGRPAAA